MKILFPDELGLIKIVPTREISEKGCPLLNTGKILKTDFFKGSFALTRGCSVVGSE